MEITATTTCPEHPNRAVVDACVRCGAFLCDWCVKTAPSWAPRHCAECQRRRDQDRSANATPSFSYLGRLVLVIIGGVALATLLDLRSAWLAFPRPLDAWSTVYLVLMAVLFGLTAAATVLFATGVRAGLVLARVSMGLAAAGALFDLLAATEQPGELDGPKLGLVIRFAVCAMLLLYLFVSDEVRSTFKRPADGAR